MRVLFVSPQRSLSFGMKNWTAPSNMTKEITMSKLVRTLYNNKMMYLVSLEELYRNLGYETKLNGKEGKLEIFANENKLQELKNDPQLLENI